MIAALAVAPGGAGNHEGADAGAGDAGSAADARDVHAWTLPDAGPQPVCLASVDCRVEQVVAGLAHTCALLGDGRVACWGWTDRFQLAREGLERSVRPVHVEGLPPMTRLMGGNIYTCGLAPSGALWCWGDGTELMFDRTGSPSTGWLSPVSDVVAIEGGMAHVCALQSTGQVYCWGFRNGNGQLGIGTREIHREPALVPGLGDVVQIALGGCHTCARTRAGQVLCWGSNEQGQVGDGRGGTGDFEMDALSPVVVLEGARRVIAGYAFTCALLESGEVRCWGDNGRGQLGVGSFDDTFASPQAVHLPLGADIVELAAAPSAGFACALERSGRVLCWGDNGGGHLGYGNPGGQTFEPVEVGGVDDATAIALGDSHTCAIRAGGALWCWGLNEDGQLGDGTTENRDLPVPVVGLR